MIFITGASSGIGEACARRFAAEGHDIFLAARRLERLDALAGELRKKHRIKASTMALDVTDRMALASLLKREPALAKTEVLLNNAGLAKGMEPLQSSDPQHWDTMIDTNLKGLLYVTRALLPPMIERGRGHVINLGSVAGRWVYPKGAVYCATKFAVRALTEGLRLDVHGTGVRVTSVDPGMVETEFSEVRLGDKRAAKAVYHGMTPLSPADVADAVYWAASRPAHVNIQEIVLFPTEQSAVGLVKRNPS